MTDTAPDTGNDASNTDATSVSLTIPPPPQPAPDTGTDLEAEVAKWKDLARKHEDRAKANSAAAKDLEKLRVASMTEQEKAVAQAKADARQETLAEVGSRIAASEVRVAAAGRLDDDQLSTLLDNVNLSKFLTDDGEVDTEKVKAFVDGIAPKPTDAGFQTADLGQGARGAPALNSDPLLASLKAAVGAK